MVSVKDNEVRDKLKELVGGSIEISTGISGAVEVALIEEADILLSSMVGAVGLKPTYEAIKAGKTIALANKETLVAAGEIMMNKAREKKVKILPVDSEHSAIFQSIEGNLKEDIKKIILTASGGPFRDYEGDLSRVTVDQALKHPNWSMGAKITIDSATMMNKGLEVIEAHWLFDIPEDRIDVLIHPESIVHSMVEYNDGSTIAQLGLPDMKTPISYALAYPGRITSGVKSINWRDIKELTFREPDHERFPMITYARTAIKEGGSLAAVMNAANEVAVQAFLDRKITFTGISKIINAVISSHNSVSLGSIEDVFAADAEGRRMAETEVTRLT